MTRYGDMPAHNLLWRECEKSSDNVAARLAVIPLVQVIIDSWVYIFLTAADVRLYYNMILQLFYFEAVMSFLSCHYDLLVLSLICVPCITFI